LSTHIFTFYFTPLPKKSFIDSKFQATIDIRDNILYNKLCKGCIYAKEAVKIFFSSNNIKINNFFTVCDAIAANNTPTRKFIAEESGLSYPTVSKTLETLLDLGVLKEKTDGKSYIYRFNDKFLFAVADLRESFRMTFTDLGGCNKYSFNFKEDDSFFYDEKLSLFLRDASFMAKRRFPKNTIIGVSVILPSIIDKRRDTRGILSSKERLFRLIGSYFPSTHAEVTNGMACTTHLFDNKRGIVIMYEQRKVLCTAVGYGVDRVSVLKSVNTTKLGKCLSSDELASEISFAVGNLCDVLEPELIVIDGSGMFTASAFPRKFRDSLLRFNCTDEYKLPEIRHTSGDLSIVGAISLQRREYVTKLLRQENGK